MTAADDRGPAVPPLSVVVITHDRCRELARTLGRLTALPERPPVVVVDNGSTDGTAGMVRVQFPGVTLISAGSNLGAAGRNLGVGATSSRYVAFCDDDTWWAPGALARAVQTLDAHPTVAVLTARILVEPKGTEDPICVDLRTSPLGRAGGTLPGPRLISFLAGASVVRRAAFVAVGGFEPRFFIGGEEELLASDLLAEGWAIVHLAELEVHHWPSGARDPHLRRRHGIRNTLWFTWLRRPWPSALARSASLLRRLPRDRVSAGGVLDACRGARWVLRERRVVPEEVEAMYRTIDEVQFRSGARRYVS